MTMYFIAYKKNGQICYLQEGPFIDEELARENLTRYSLNPGYVLCEAEFPVEIKECE